MSNSPPIPGSRSPFPYGVSLLQGVTHGVPRPTLAASSGDPLGKPAGCIADSFFPWRPTRAWRSASGSAPAKPEPCPPHQLQKESVCWGEDLPGPSPGAPAPSARQGDPDAVPATPGPSAPLLRRPVASLEAAAPSKRRGRKPPLA
ncbi:hypothetical protein NDU88_004279 [Pleurodeles waltl]|uniref:Uncharacterized protein n=1 Tax=Pleurodeles waltl TaxID=8319 RepID=A0AAV7LHV2_PLEWA|nr:hypothetical protein NDU88_004279 [Pleurodeles waltl]